MKHMCGNLGWLLLGLGISILFRVIFMFVLLGFLGLFVFFVLLRRLLFFLLLILLVRVL